MFKDINLSAHTSLDFFHLFCIISCIGALTQAIRNFAKSLEGWLSNAMNNIPQRMIQTKVNYRVTLTCQNSWNKKALWNTSKALLPSLLFLFCKKNVKSTSFKNVCSFQPSYNMRFNILCSGHLWCSFILLETQFIYELFLNAVLCLCTSQL